MNPIKEAFSKAKQDILDLQTQLDQIKRDIHYIKSSIQELNFIKNQTNIPKIVPTDNENKPTDKKETSTDDSIPTDKSSLYGLKDHFTNSSTGNRGVPTNRQTNQQTDQHIEKFALNETNDEISKLEEVSKVLQSLDYIKKDLRVKVKRLSEQEMRVFSLIYQFEEEGYIVDYSLLASKLSLSESSIRDYILKIIKKGIPIVKNKENNKKVTLSIPDSFRKLANLETLTTLREL